MPRTIGTFLFFLAFFSAARASMPQEGRIDEDQTRDIRSFTTRPEFLSPLVDHLPASADGVPSPKEVLGYTIGAPGKMTYYSNVVRYLEALGDESQRVKVFSLGTSHEGRRILAAAVSSEANIEGLEDYRSMTAALADPRKTSEEEARRIIDEGRVIYTVMGAVQGAETASPEMMMELAYRLAVSTEPMVDRIRENVIVLILPVFAPDGRDRYIDWYYRHLSQITDQRDWLPASPYWSKYLYHDTNRDGIALSQPQTRALLNLFDRFHPQVIDDFHESLPFLYIFTGTGPNYPRYDPIYEGELLWLAHHEMAQMLRWGMPGVWVHDFAQAWYPGYVAWIAVNRNAIGRFHQSFGNGGASTVERKLTEPVLSIFNFPRLFTNRLSREWFRPVPPYEEVNWSHRNNINYQQTAVLSGLDLVARYRDTFLENFWKKSSRSLQLGQTEAPYSWVIPAGQGRKGERDAESRTAALVNLLRAHGIEVHRLSTATRVARAIQTTGVDGVSTGEEPFVDDVTLPSGSYLVRMDQPYRNFIQTLFEIQRYPKDAPRSYDDTAWTLGLTYGVRTLAVIDQAILDAPAERVTDDLPDAYNATGALETRYRGAGAPRIGLVYTWKYTQDTGWIRYTLDTLGVPYRLVNEEMLRKGNLNEGFDVLLFGPASPPGRGDATSIIHGIDAKYGPLAYTKTDRFRYLGDYDASEDITGGMGLQGVRNLQSFVEKGGTLITIGSACLVPIQYGMLRDVKLVAAPEVVIPGSILKVKNVNENHPVTAGYSSNLAVFFASGPIFSVTGDTGRQSNSTVLLRFDEDRLLLSGLAQKADALLGQPAVIDARVGEGHVVLFSFNPVHRWLTFNTFDLLFNTIFHHERLAGYSGR